MIDVEQPQSPALQVDEKMINQHANRGFVQPAMNAPRPELEDGWYGGMKMEKVGGWYCWRS